ncbi:hypothetical protein ACRAWD_29090 [Caulobacter segnis]
MPFGFWNSRPTPGLAGGLQGPPVAPSKLDQQPRLVATGLRRTPQEASIGMLQQARGFVQNSFARMDVRITDPTFPLSGLPAELVEHHHPCGARGRARRPTTTAYEADPGVQVELQVRDARPPRGAAPWQSMSPSDVELEALARLRRSASPTPRPTSADLAGPARRRGREGAPVALVSRTRL